MIYAYAGIAFFAVSLLLQFVQYLRPSATPTLFLCAIASTCASFVCMAKAIA